MTMVNGWQFPARDNRVDNQLNNQPAAHREVQATVVSPAQVHGAAKRTMLLGMSDTYKSHSSHSVVIMGRLCVKCLLSVGPQARRECMPSWYTSRSTEPSERETNDPLIHTCSIWLPCALSHFHTPPITQYPAVDI